MRYTGPKNKIARRQATDLGLKTAGSKSHASLLKKMNIRPGQHGTRYRRKESEHARQLIEKQKLRYLFGLTESQLKKYFTIASRKKGNTAIYLGELLERRLDNILYRLGFTPTRAAARQLVTHGHIAVNDKKINIPSYLMKNNEKISFLTKKTKEIPYIQIFCETSDVIVPVWLEAKKDSGLLTQTPDNTLIQQQVNLRLVIEFYSR
ncbi:MAG: 30S ribosomal protein S4 [Candidatus Roizmanbacteria bacterium GW2011_GWA2_37_7]|uniref:Small ribosomal subunit protein uS4 n=1 Tax=Candidatus Roizmanbacteria bacterium GW2011_GWA2_37_7 TaxID=1618481 RepID=A0A0G0KCM1_9BACT|nr:MAG: 30S ribosomal protein S4 [Candidatus Roizmanbacteria bacterium GW2011_GWA2_37_7]